MTHLKTPEAKKLIIKRYLESQSYQKAYLFDDSLDNIDSFSDLKVMFPSVELFPQHITISLK